jgi:hypothetical protein
MVFEGKQVGRNETLISGGNTDGPEGAGLEPESVLRRAQSYLYDFA